MSSSEGRSVERSASACASQRRASGRRPASRDHAGVQEQPCVPGVPRKRAVHRGDALRRDAPAAASAQARASRVKTSRRTVSSRSVSTSACVRRCAASPERAQPSADRRRPRAHELLLDRRGLVVAAASAQCVGQRPLILGKRIQIRRALERANGFARSIHASRRARVQQCGGVVRLKGQRRIGRASRRRRDAACSS